MAKYENIRRIYMDLDDVVFNSSPQIQFHVEKNFPQFSSQKLRMREGNLFLWNNCLQNAMIEIAKAKEGQRVIKLAGPQHRGHRVFQEDSGPGGATRLPAEESIGKDRPGEHNPAHHRRKGQGQECPGSRGAGITRQG